MKHMNAWNRFAENHPKAAKWIREGGLFVIVSNVITVFKYVILQFLPSVFSGLSHAGFCLQHWYGRFEWRNLHGDFLFCQ